VIIGSHVIVFSSDPDADRAFFADVLGHPHVDAGGGWLIFKLPPAELAVHPSDGPTGHELYFMCDDLEATMSDLQAKGVELPTTFPRSGGDGSPGSGCPGAARSESTSRAIRSLSTCEQSNRTILNPRHSAATGPSDRALSPVGSLSAPSPC
jgi:catechol 2,3-dioxygenase-like lactoylglutathione lyase family enzyme